MKLEKFGDAETAYQKAIALDPKDPESYYVLALALNEQAKSARSEASRVDLLAKACQSLTEGLRQVPDEPHLVEGRAAIASKLPESARCAP